MPQGGSPMWFGAVQFGFSLLWGLVSCRSELQLRKLDTLRGCRFGGLGLTEIPASRHEHANKPQPNKSEAPTNPRQNTHHSHTARVLSCSFKPAAPIQPGTQNAQNQNSSSAKPLPPNLQGFKFGGLGFAGIVRTPEMVDYPNPSPPHVQPPPVPPPTPRSHPLPERPAGHLGGNNA